MFSIIVTRIGNEEHLDKCYGELQKEFHSVANIDVYTA